jgi:exonuclease III
MKIASFNVKNINRRLANLLHWLREAKPEILRLQGLKAADTEFPVDVIRQAGCHAVWRGEKRWNWVAILARWVPARSRSYHALPKTIRYSDGKEAGSILGFANCLLRLHADE